MNLDEFFTFDNAEMISPIGLSFGISGGAVDLFLLEVIGDKDSPIRSDGRILAFDDETLCRSCLEHLSPILPRGVIVDHKYDFVCDIHRATKIVADQEIDEEAVVLNCINTLMDFVETGEFELPCEYRILRAFADRLTFRAEFGEFTQVRTLLLNALIWCAGVSVLAVKVVKSVTEFESLIPSLRAAPHRSDILTGTGGMGRL